MTDRETADVFGTSMASHIFASFLNTSFRGPSMTWESVVRMAKRHAVAQMGVQTDWAEERLEAQREVAETSAERWMAELLKSAGFTPDDYMRAGTNGTAP